VNKIDRLSMAVYRSCCYAPLDFVSVSLSVVVNLSLLNLRIDVERHCHLYISALCVQCRATGNVSYFVLS